MSPDTDNRDRRRDYSRSRSPRTSGSRRRRDYSQERSRDYDKEHTRRRRSPERDSEKRDDYRRRRRDHPVSFGKDSDRPRSREKRDHETRRRRHDSSELDERSTRRDKRHRSRSKETRGRRRSGDRRDRSRSPAAPVRSRGPLPSQNDAFESTEVTKTGSPAPVKEKPNFANTGRLAAESNTIAVNGSTVVLKYHEPPEARKPPAKDDWRLYVFKDEDLLEMVQLGERSCWLIGREKLVVDFPIEHPSCSKQHAAIQFRYVEKKNEFGDKMGRVRPYLIDLESSNGSMVNGDVVPGGRYIELRDKDVLKFGHSTREYMVGTTTIATGKMITNNKPLSMQLIMV
ncbi:FHA domain protein SNIP1, putative [Talaromyces stipitatus ATCC 10500]|uniref:FHA domain protein SNIP1, putative n=1 Tax=Talaromyces stipitatus (strain ATCC 10500 / CBS 375.48 / QM 6759 / NRRL 1006) TaxID=441959 RepID=B8M6I4_TALSN|nr:FHA domain protein SNIP1, putative [Talaromyces stipitatus ATCC 10500]EED19446.1 FHA domain protein SNIP1, putative [Talaromyces stipitatus ATCC 10500]